VSNLIAIDWGTSSFRAYLIDAAGKVLQKSVAEKGILSVENGAFEHCLEMQLRKFPDISSETPIIAAGMITSRQGWCETPYICCPACAKNLAENLISFESAGFGTVWFVPGVNQFLPEPDIMRGEETQLAGIETIEEVIAIMPGTHSKWVEMKDQTISRFKTFMTGELFAIVMKHSILGSVSGTIWSDKSFKRGVRKGFSFAETGGGLLSALFQVRVETILAQESETDSSSHVSGLLIGCEIAEAVGSGFDTIQKKLIIGEARLAKIYRMALLECGLDAAVGPGDVSAHGLYRIARYKNLI
jgi:2-dehydro-3-deoxygalactonokinase